MKLKYVTLTGADNTVQPEKLVELSLKYPFVEWAILFSQNKTGQPRYPTLDWVDALIDYSRDYPDMHFSAHLCGKWVENAMQGEITFFRKTDYDLRFKRVQLNMGTDRLKRSLTCQPLLDAVNYCQKDVILGGNYRHIKVDSAFFLKTGFLPLFDASGGRGVETKDWPTPFYDEEGNAILCGYAGGLGPDNVATELPRIEEEVGVNWCWIDMETKLRTVKGGKDMFDLEKCEAVLQAAKPWIG